MADSDPTVPGRPLTVTAAGYLLYLVAAALVGNAIGLWAITGRVSDAARQAWAAVPKDADKYAAAYHSGLTVAGIVFVIVAAVLVVLGALDLRGVNLARILTWVVGAVLTLCCGCLAIGQFTSGTGTAVTAGGSTVDGVDVARANQQIGDAFPGWSTALFILLLVVGLPALIATIVLLTLPSSRAYFRPAESLEEDFLSGPIDAPKDEAEVTDKVEPAPDPEAAPAPDPAPEAEPGREPDQDRREQG